jgi:L-fucose isomerase-like protein
MTSVSLIALARPTFDVETAQKNFDTARLVLQELGATLSGPEFLVMTPEDVAKTRVLPSDFYILFLASFSDSSPAIELLSKVPGPVLLWSTTEPGDVGERLRLNSMCGANLAAHALVHEGQSVRHLHGNPEEPATKKRLASILEGNFPDDTTPPHQFRELADEAVADEALTKLSKFRIGAVGEAPTGFTPCQFDEDKLNSLFGIQVEKMDMTEAFKRISMTSVTKSSSAHRVAVAAQPSLADVHEGQALKVAGVEVALDEWREKNALNAIAIRCWPEFPTELGACVCSALGRLSDRGLVTTCERDVLGAVTMLLCEALGSDENYLVDIVDLVERENLIRLWHCGSAATKLAADPNRATQYIHCNRKLGVAGNFPLKTGPVTLVRIDRDVDQSNNSGLRMIVSRGESIPAPNYFQGNTASVRTEPNAANLINGIVTHGYPHHLVISWIDVRPGLRRVAHKLGIPLKEW